jgi:hypothetical protein
MVLRQRAVSIFRDERSSIFDLTPISMHVTRREQARRFAKRRRPTGPPGKDQAGLRRLRHLLRPRPRRAGRKTVEARMVNKSSRASVSYCPGELPGTSSEDGIQGGLLTKAQRRNMRFAGLSEAIGRVSYSTGELFWIPSQSLKSGQLRVHTSTSHTLESWPTSPCA